MKYQRSTHSAGFSITQALVAIAIVSTALVGLMSYFDLQLRIQKQMQLKFQLDSLRKQMLGILESPNAWPRTMASPLNNRAAGPALDCLTGTPCTVNGAANGIPISNFPIVEIQDGLGGVRLNNAAPGSGFSTDGVPCAGFVAPPGAGNDACPLRINISWTALCRPVPGPPPTTDCVNPGVQILLQPVYNGRLTMPYNPALYSATHIIGGGAGGGCWTPQGGTLVETCNLNVLIGGPTPDPAWKLDVVQNWPNTPMGLRIKNFALGPDAASELMLETAAAADAYIRMESAIGVDWFAGLDASENAFKIGMTTGPIVGPGVNDLFTLKSDGSVGIGTTTPDQKFVVFNGTTTGKYTATGWTHSSDLRYKHDVQPLKNMLQNIVRIRGVHFRFNSDPTEKLQLGFIAQELETIFPEVVETDRSGYKSVAYANLAAALVEAVKELNVKNQELSAELAEIKRWHCEQSSTAPFCK